MNNNREKFLDIAKGIGIILVIIGHTDAPTIIIHFIYGFHMPLFFIISGYLYNKKKWNEQEIKSLVISRLRMYVVPYFFYSILNLVINFPMEYIAGVRGKNLILSTFKHIFWIIYSYGDGSRTPNCTPLWFLICLFVCNIYFYYLQKIKNPNIQLMVGICMLYLSVFLSKCQIQHLPWHIENAFVGAMFMLIGLKIKEKNVLEKIRGKEKYSTILLFIGVICIAMNDRVDININYVGNPILFIVGATFVSIYILDRAFYLKRGEKLFLHMGNGTILVMAFNYAINTYSLFVWEKMPLCNNYSYKWWIKSLVGIIVCYYLIYLRNIISNKWSERSKNVI